MSQREIVFVTTNKGKIASAQNYFNNIKLIPYNAELIEPRSDDVKEISTQKVKQAYEIVGQPCIAVDAGFFIEQLNGFPKAYVNFALDTIGIDGILKLMEGIDDRNCYFKACLSYYDGKTLKHFENITPGKLAESKTVRESEQQWSELWYIFIPDGFDKTLGEFTKADFERYDKVKDPSCIYKFGQWYEKEHDREIHLNI